MDQQDLAYFQKQCGSTASSFGIERRAAARSTSFGCTLLDLHARPPVQLHPPDFNTTASWTYLKLFLSRFARSVSQTIVTLRRQRSVMRYTLGRRQHSTLFCKPPSPHALLHAASGKPPAAILFLLLVLCSRSLITDKCDRAVKNQAKFPSGQIPVVCMALLLRTRIPVLSCDDQYERRKTVRISPSVF